MKSFKSFCEEMKTKYHYFDVKSKDGSKIPEIDKIKGRGVATTFDKDKGDQHKTFGMYDADPQKVRDHITSHLAKKHGMKEGEHYTIEKK